MLGITHKAYVPIKQIFIPKNPLLLFFLFYVTSVKKLIAILAQI
jgi:hypothetical protein